jgi:hypothetical protein
MTVDPVAGETEQRYSYADGNPLTSVDPLGLGVWPWTWTRSTWEKVGLGAGAVAIGATGVGLLAEGTIGTTAGIVAVGSGLVAVGADAKACAQTHEPRACLGALLGGASVGLGLADLLVLEEDLGDLAEVTAIELNIAAEVADLVDALSGHVNQPAPNYPQSSWSTNIPIPPWLQNEDLQAMKEWVEQCAL